MFCSDGLHSHPPGSLQNVSGSSTRTFTQSVALLARSTQQQSMPLICAATDQVYFEDNDYAIRLQVSGFRAAIIRNATVQHGPYRDGSIGYISGTVGTITAWSGVSREVQLELSNTKDRGVASAQGYIHAKWGTGKPPTRFKGPFNQGRVPVSAWQLQLGRRKWIMTGVSTLEAGVTEDDPELKGFLQSQQHSPVAADSIFIEDHHTICSTEDKMCDCSGYVVFGPAISPRDDNLYPRLATVEEIAANAVQARAQGSIFCSNQEFGEDPAYDSVKYCRCFDEPVPNVKRVADLERHEQVCNEANTATDCVLWRQTGACGDGAREPEHDASCGSLIFGGQSGFCECCGGRIVKFACEHQFFRCRDVCASNEAELSVLRSSIDTVGYEDPSTWWATSDSSTKDVLGLFTLCFEL